MTEVIMIALPGDNDAQALLRLDIARAEQGCRPEAIQHLQAALRVRPDFVQAHYNLAKAKGAIRDSFRIPNELNRSALVLQVSRLTPTCSLAIGSLP